MPWFTVDQVSDDHNVGRTQIYGEINEGRLKVIKIGRSTRITAEAISDWQKLLERESPQAREKWRRRIKKQTSKNPERRSDHDDDHGDGEEDDGEPP